MSRNIAHYRWLSNPPVHYNWFCTAPMEIAAVIPATDFWQPESFIEN
ncbi:MAG TPA: hypothetical protein VGH42_07705 [Verrucomicrobiae bacterium]|jgi:hypothetical protein